MHDSPGISSEDELIGRAMQGDPEAFGELYVGHLDRIYRYIFYRVGHVPEAEDLTEQVFLRAWQVMGRYRREGIPFSAWLYRIAHNLVIDYYRATKTVVPLHSDHLTLSREALSPEEQLVHKAEVTRLREAIARLSEPQREVILLRFVEGLSHAQVACRVGKSEGAVRVMQHRALAALSQILGEG